RAVAEAKMLGRRLGRRDWFLEGQAHLYLVYQCYLAKDFKQARKSARAAVEAFSRLPKSHHEARLELARALRCEAQLQRIHETSRIRRLSVRTAERAIEILTKVRAASHDPAVLMLEAECRSTLASCLEVPDRWEEAIDEERRSLVIREDLFRQSALV